MSIDPIATFIVFFAVVDPIGTVPVFLAATRGFDPAAQRRTALRAALVSAVILVAFTVLGEPLLSALEIPLPAFQIAGGIVLFLFALSMIFGESKPDQEVRMIADEMEVAVFPLAIPSVAGPGAILAAVLMTENSRYGVSAQIETTIVMLSVVAFAGACMLAAGRINRVIGSAGASVVSRVMGLILAAVAVNDTLEGLQLFFE